MNEDEGWRIHLFHNEIGLIEKCENRTTLKRDQSQGG